MTEITVASFIISLLLGTNAFFIKRLVEKIDSTGKAQERTANDVNQLSVNVRGVSDQLTEIKGDIKELRRVEIDVAVLKAQYNNKNASIEDA